MNIFSDSNTRKENLNFQLLKGTIRCTFDIASDILQLTLFDIFVLIERNTYAVNNGPLQSNRRKILLFNNLSALQKTPVRLDKNKVLRFAALLHKVKTEV